MSELEKEIGKLSLELSLKLSDAFTALLAPYETSVSDKRVVYRAIESSMYTFTGVVFSTLTEIVLPEKKQGFIKTAKEKMNEVYEKILIDNKLKNKKEYN